MRCGCSKVLLRQPGQRPRQTVWGEIHAARSYYLVSDADLAAQQAAAELALTLLPPDHTQGRGFALISLARIYRWQGRLPAAERLLEQALDEHGLHQDALTLRLLTALTLHHTYTLQLDQAERVGQLYLTLAQAGGLKTSLGSAHALMGAVACLRTDNLRRQTAISTPMPPSRKLHGPRCCWRRSICISCWPAIATPNAARRSLPSWSSCSAWLTSMAARKCCARSKRCRLSLRCGAGTK
jgi:hypothetical protein